ncbi:hypothetical protein [Anaerosacchariphilus polymeriproducens]|uniref:Uncharacterized protein n=1 Tax=Anaerosacchariphilus polymeriproducens TaxID=1812858 RepID=A0A371AUP1_9FIRM|nr:hypothetical protein [Anaerosacchariphilus polymeriproducens]RDU23259.1 hypothetical protein DWV06_10480 [Anaerosacchariphilus polymeriproducens]
MGNSSKGASKGTSIEPTQVEKQLQELEAVRIKLNDLSKILHTQNAELVKAWDGEGGIGFLNASASQENEISNHIKAIENLMAGISGTLYDLKEVDDKMSLLLEEVGKETKVKK